MKRLAEPAANSPLLDSERLFRRLFAARGVILAVSGGPDSTALMVLVSRWTSRPPALVVSVDHGLRPEAAGEARQVAANAESLGLPWRIIKVPGTFSGGNLQDWARRARYDCLAAAARDAGFDTIVTAHHQDDQAETFMLRLARGSGVYGLASMAGETTVDGLRLARPLLEIPRAALLAIAADSGLPVASDPSNDDPRFDRVRMRRQMPALAEFGLTAERLSGTAASLGRAAAALDHYANVLLEREFHADDFGVVSGSVRGLADAPNEVGLRALALMLQAVGGAEYTPRLDHMEPALAAVLACSAEGRLKRTLHGVVLELRQGRLTAQREWGRVGIAAVTGPSGAVLHWDRRFRVRIPPGDDLSIGPLGRSNRRLRSDAADRISLRTLPGLFTGETLLAVPDGVRADDKGDQLARLAAECTVSERLGLARRSANRPADHHVGS